MNWLSSFSQVDIYGLAVTGGVTVLLVLGIRLLLPRVLRRVSERVGIAYRDSAWRHIITPLWVLVLLLGLWAVAVQIPVPEAWAENYQKYLGMAASVLVTILVIYGLLRLFNAFAEQHRVRLREAHDPRSIYVGAIKKIVSIVLLVLGMIIILGQLGYEIGPLLASLGIAGIAVALALQDTLGNLFAGFYLTFDQPIRPGDYIKLNSGEEGFVEEIGWRNTRIRPWQNNIVIIPNSKLSETVITNWHLPEPEMSVYVWCGVDYGSDLEQVERVCIEVGQEVLSRVEGAVRDWQPAVRFKEFADSNINFVVVLRAADPTVTYLLQHEYMKALLKRFKQEGIEISWPVQKVVFPEDSPPSAPSSPAGP